MASALPRHIAQARRIVSARRGQANDRQKNNTSDAIVVEHPAYWHGELVAVHNISFNVAEESMEESK